MDQREIRKENVRCESCTWCMGEKCIYGPVSLNLPERRTCAQHPVHQLALHTWLHKQCYGDAEVFCPPQEDDRTGHERRKSYNTTLHTRRTGRDRRTHMGTIADRHIQTSPFPPRPKSPIQEESDAYAMLLEQRDEARAELAEVRAELAYTQGLVTSAIKLLHDYERQLASCAAGPWEPFDPEKHKDGLERLSRFRGYSDKPFVAAATWNINHWTHCNGMHLPESDPSHVAELRDVPKDGKGDQSDGQ